MEKCLTTHVRASYANIFNHVFNVQRFLSRLKKVVQNKIMLISKYVYIDVERTLKGKEK